MNPVEAWYYKDKKLLDILMDIDKKGLSEEESAREAFYLVSEMYGLPKFIGDVDYEDDWEDEEPRSVFEEIAMVRFLFPDDLPRGIVMLALHNVYSKVGIPFDEVATEYYGSHDDIPASYFVYFFGNDVDATLKLDIGEQSWIEAGAVLMKKVMKTSYE